MEARLTLEQTVGEQSLLSEQGEPQAETQKEGNDATGALSASERDHCCGRLWVSSLPKHSLQWPTTFALVRSSPRSEGTGLSVHCVREVPRNHHTDNCVLESYL